MSPHPTQRPWLQPAARIVTVGVLATAVVLGAERLGTVDPAASETSSARVAATSTTGYCPGDPFADSGKDIPDVDIAGSVDAHAAPAKVLEGVIAPSEKPGRISMTPLATQPPSSAEESPSSGPMSESRDTLGRQPVMVRATQERAPGLVSVQSFTAGGDQVKGLAAVPCIAPTADAWLVGGGGAKGRQERLVLVNPGGNAVTARLDVLGAKGEDEGRSVVVPARGRSGVLLDAVGGTDAPQAVHVTTNGGLVVPTMVDHHLDGLTPAGVETIAPTAAPAKRQVIPGQTDGAARGIVLGAPEGRDAVVEVRAVGEDGSRSGKITTVPAGAVVDLGLPKGEGVRSLVVESDEPVVTAAYTVTGASGGERDMAWSVATPAFSTLGGVALPTEPSSDVRRVVEVAATDGPAEADVFIQQDGKLSTKAVTLTADHSEAVSIGSAEAVWVRPSSGSVHAAVLLIGPEGRARAEASSLPILPTRVSVRDVEVVQRR